MNEVRENLYSSFKDATVFSFNKLIETYLKENNITKGTKNDVITTAKELVRNKHHNYILSSVMRKITETTRDENIFLRVSSFESSSKLSLVRFTTSLFGEYLWLVFYGNNIVGVVITEGDHYKEKVINGLEEQTSPKVLFHNNLSNLEVLLHEVTNKLPHNTIETKITVTVNGYVLTCNYPYATNTGNEIYSNSLSKEQLMDEVVSAVENYIKVLEWKGDSETNKEETLELISTLLDSYK